MVDENESYPWPRATRSLWTCGGGFGHVTLGETWHRSGAYIRGYEQAAEILSDHVVSNPASRTLGYPILFLWRHTVELQLKEIIRSTRALLIDDSKFPDDEHRLSKLWTDVRTDLSRLGLNESDELSFTEVTIKELASADPRSIDARYSEHRDGQPTLRAAPGAIDLKNVRDILGGVVNFLGCVIEDLSQRLDHD
jgi:hypothetical protein